MSLAAARHGFMWNRICGMRCIISLWLIDSLPYALPTEIKKVDYQEFPPQMTSDLSSLRYLSLFACWRAASVGFLYCQIHLPFGNLCDLCSSATHL